MKEKLNWLFRKEIKPDYDYFFLCIVLFIFALLRTPSLVEPDWYGDEGIYQVIGHALVSGRLLYKDIWDNKPPVLYIYYAFVNGNLFYIRALSLLFGAAAIITFFYVAKNLFVKSRAAYFSSTAVFALLFGLPLLEGNIANAENFMLFPILLALLLILNLTNKSKIIVPASVGLLLSLAFLTKIVAIFDLGAFLVILLFLRFFHKDLVTIKKIILVKPRQLFILLKQEVTIVVFFIIPILASVLFFLFSGALPDYIKASFSQNVGYVGYGNYFLFPQGLLVTKLILLLLGVIFVWIARKKLGVPGVVIYIWLFFSIFNMFFSGRPYTHYILVLLPSFCLLVGLAASKAKYRLFHILALLIVILLVKFNFTYYSKVFPYYRNYTDFIFGKKNAGQYQAFFDSNTPRNYDIAGFIKNNTTKNDSVFLVSDSSTIYYLADKLPPGRYIVAYHISFYKDGITETQKALDEKQPKYIISSNDTLAQNFIQNYTKKMVLDNMTVYEKQ